MIYVLTYNAPHKKTQDLLFRLTAKGYNNIVVLATPWVVRNNYKPLIPHRPLLQIDIKPEHLCKRLKCSFQKVEIDNIVNVVANRKEDIVLIGGSGILPKDVVQLGNVINSHPAWLPYTRGLDALKWAIYFDNPIGVTTHFISEETDAGLLIKRELVPKIENTPSPCTLPSMLYGWRETGFRNESKCSTVGNPPSVTRRA